AFGPDVFASLRLEKLRADAEPIAGFAHTAFDHISHAEFAPDLLHINRTAFVGEAGVARYDEQRRIVRQRSNDVLGTTSWQELVIGVANHVGERQYCH